MSFILTVFSVNPQINAGCDEEGLQIDTMEEIRSLLLDYELLEESYPKENFLGYQQVLDGGVLFGYVQLEYFGASKNWNVEPVYNIVFQKKKEGFCYYVISSGYPDDFISVRTASNQLIFQYRSTSVGFFQYFKFDQDKGGLLRSKRYDEVEHIDFVNMKMTEIQFKDCFNS